MKTWIFSTYFRKINTKFDENPSSGSLVDRHGEATALRSFATGPKNCKDEQSPGRHLNFEPPYYKGVLPISTRISEYCLCSVHIDQVTAMFYVSFPICSLFV